MGPGLNSTLAFTGDAIVCASEASLDLEVVVGGVEKKRAVNRKSCGEFVILLYKGRATLEDVGGWDMRVL